MITNNQKIRTSDRHDVRAEIAHQGIRGLLILNGGACVAMLGFTQALWRTPGEPHPLMSFLFWSLLLYALGAFFGSTVFIPRYFTSLRYEQRKKSAAFWEKISWSLQAVPLLCFFSGTIVFVVGGFRTLGSL